MRVLETNRRGPAYVYQASTKEHAMLRTLFSVGLMTMVGVFALRLVFGIFVGLVGLFMWLFFLALKILIVIAVIYFLIRLISPSTARRMSDSINNSPGA